MPSSAVAGKHRTDHRPAARPGRSALLALLATLVVLLSTGTVMGLTAIPVATTPDPPVGSAVIGAAPAATPAAPPAATSAATPPRTYAVPAERSPAAGSRAAALPTVDDGILAWEERVLELTNDERLAAGCGNELVMDERLRAAARGHSHDMAVNDYFDHNSLDGRSPTDRARAAGYPGSVGENIAVGYRSPEAVMQGWMTSEGHRDNILRCSYTGIGVGLAYDAGGRPYWTQNFGSL